MCHDDKLKQLIYRPKSFYAMYIVYKIITFKKINMVKHVENTDMVRISIKFGIRTKQLYIIQINYSNFYTACIVRRNSLVDRSDDYHLFLYLRMYIQMYCFVIIMIRGCK